MRNIYIETDENFRVTKIHRAPFDPNNGMGYTREELEKKGFFVDKVPAATNQIGKRSIAMYNPDTKSIYYEYANIPLSDKERVGQLENVVNFMMNNAMYGIGYSISTMDLDVEDEPTYELNIHEIGAADYLASQIVSGKLDAAECLNMFPQFADHIKKKLKESGIQL